MRSTADLQALINEIDVNIRDAQSAQSASTEGRSWTAQTLSELRNQRTALIRELESVTARNSGARNPMGVRVTWNR